jgi:hypothetical protein
MRLACRASRAIHQRASRFRAAISSAVNVSTGSGISQNAATARMVVASGARRPNRKSSSAVLDTPSLVDTSAQVSWRELFASSSFFTKSVSISA